MLHTAQKISRSPHVLIVDDERDICELVSHLLEQSGIVPHVATNGTTALEMLNKISPDLLLLDLKLPDFDGMEILRQARGMDEDLPVVILTALGGVRDAVEAIKAHAFEFMSKPYDHHELLRVVRAGLAERQLKRSSRQFASQIDARHELSAIMGSSALIGNLISDVKRVSKCNFNVVIIGETGSGKEVIAQAIHKASPRADKPFIPIDCGAIPENLIEGELFGHEKGAFTGATGQTQGRFEQADGGTLFLDEILNMPLNAQAKVLRALQEKCICRVGGTEQIKVDVRVLAAVNQNLEQAVASGRFRMDLLYRLTEFTLRIPPLRDRKADIIHLANRFLEMTNHELGKEVKGFTEEAIQTLLNHPWPGNVRQLRSTIRRAVLLADDFITNKHLDVLPYETSMPSISVAASGFMMPAAPNLPLKQIVAQSTMMIERSILIMTLRQTQGNKAMAARLLQIDYKTIQSKLKHYGIGKLQEIQ